MSIPDSYRDSYMNDEQRCAGQNLARAARRMILKQARTFENEVKFIENYRLARPQSRG